MHAINPQLAVSHMGLRYNHRMFGEESVLPSDEATQSEPTFSPDDWGETEDVQFDNNCYSYACDVKAGYAQPGLASGKPYQSLSCEALTQAAIEDGLIPTNSYEILEPKPGCHIVALAIAPNITHHWYRRDADGTWSHKPGDKLPTKLDSSGNVIYDPRTADRRPYVLFCGFFYVCKDCLKIRDNYNLPLGQSLLQPFSDFDYPCTQHLLRPTLLPDTPR